METSQMKFPDKLKLVIWDLDDTFWSGTLSEGGVAGIERNINIVKTLSRRGIVNSISSKNTHEEAVSELKRLGVDELFVFKKINWAPKGEQVRNTIKDMGLRDVNCVFIDDNLLNLNEVKASCPDIFAFHPDEILDTLLEMPGARGKSDPQMDRLAQYKILEQRTQVQKEQKLSNLDFLRTCDLRIEIDYNTNSHIDRIIELLDRTNQLNYTKIRLLNEKDKANFLNDLKDYNTNAGVVSCSDKFGNYGIVGFFMVKNQFAKNPRLEHFVFSCRTMNMGLEAYIYRKLNKPEINVRGPVAYEIDQYGEVDWVTEGSTYLNATETLSTVLLGPCHFLQLSNFIGAEHNFVQYVKDGSVVKFDCPAFLSGDREGICTSDFIKQGYSWSIEEFDEFHEAILSADRIILSLEDMLVDRNYVYENKMYFRYDGNKKINANIRSLHINQRIKLLFDILTKISEVSKPSCELIILDGLLTKSTPKHLQQVRLTYSQFIYKYFGHTYKIFDLAKYAPSQNVDGIHLDRLGYFNLSRAIERNDSSCSMNFDYSNYDDRNNRRTRLNKFRQRFIQFIGRDSILYSWARGFNKYFNKL